MSEWDWVALNLCVEAHKGQRYGDGEYAMHPIRVALRVPDDCRITALLHDVLEDTDYDPDVIKRRFGATNFNAMLLLTRAGEEPYDAYIQRICDAPDEAGRIARQVKLADLWENSQDRPSKKYLDSMRAILSAMSRHYEKPEIDFD